MASKQRPKKMRYQLTRWAIQVKWAVGGRCDVCGKTHHDSLDERGLPVPMEAHHLWGFANYPETRFDPANGVCLCHEHHRAFHDQYGYEHNTPMQYGEFRYMTRLAMPKKGRPAHPVTMASLMGHPARVSRPNLQNIPVRDGPHRPAFRQLILS